MLNVFLFEGEQKRVVLCVPLNANELLLPAKRAELQELCVSSSDYLTQRSNAMSETVQPFMFKPMLDNDESQGEVTTCRMQQEVSEWFVDECM